MSSTAALTANEKEWLKANYKDEYHFLQQHGLSIYKEEDRQEGREIVRTLMAAEDEDEDEEESHPFDESARLLMDLSKAENAWVKEHYEGASNFLYAYGLKQPDVHDAEEGGRILRGLMGEKKT